MTYLLIILRSVETILKLLTNGARLFTLYLVKAEIAI